MGLRKKTSVDVKPCAVFTRAFRPSSSRSPHIRLASHIDSLTDFTRPGWDHYKQNVLSFSRPANSLDAKMPSADLFGSRCAFKKCVSIRVVQKTPTLEIESRSSGSPWFQTRWVQWCTKKSISSTIRGRELNFKFSKMHWRSKNQNAKIISSVCLKYAKWWEDSKSGLSIQVG